MLALFPVLCRSSRAGCIAQWLAYLPLDPAALSLIPRVPKKNSVEKIVHAADLKQQHCLEKSGQCLENVDQTHLVLASGKLVQQKISVVA